MHSPLYYVMKESNNNNLNVRDAECGTTTMRNQFIPPWESNRTCFAYIMDPVF